ncbi:MAG: NAD-dependent epimerase/dehydratase family protein [Gemmatimonadales bacterium]
MTVLVTGGGGLVGSHVIEALRARGDSVRALVRERGESRAIVERLGAQTVIGDVTNADAWRRAAEGVDGIVHAAAIVQRRASYDEYVRVNVGGTGLAVETARAVGARLVHISSVAVYGGTAAYRPERERQTEDHPFGPIADHDFYARTKRAAEELVRDSARGGGVPAVALRPNVIYGERDRLFTPRLIRIARRRFLPLVGPGTNHLACVYAGNVAAAAVAALEAPLDGFRAYNVTTDAEPRLTQREFLVTFAAALGAKPRIVPVPRLLARVFIALLAGPRLARAGLSFATGENPYVAERAREELGWRPPFTPGQAIERTVRWFLTGAARGR